MSLILRADEVRLRGRGLTLPKVLDEGIASKLLNPLLRCTIKIKMTLKKHLTARKIKSLTILHYIILYIILFNLDNINIYNYYHPPWLGRRFNMGRALSAA